MKNRIKYYLGLIITLAIAKINMPQIFGEQQIITQNLSYTKFNSLKLIIQ